MLTPPLLHPLLASLSRTLTRGGAQDPEAAAALLESFHPQTPIQAMLAAQAIALHHAAMDCFGRAMETEPEDHATAARMQRNAASLTRAFTATLRTLQRCQTEAAREEAMQRGTGWNEKELFPAPRRLAPQDGPWAGRGVETPPNPDPSTPPPCHLSQEKREFLHSPAVHATGGSAPSVQSAPPSPEDLMQREQPTQRRWEDLSEAEQFAILYPERAAAGATSHEDADLWLPQFTRQPAPQPATR